MGSATVLNSDLVTISINFCESKIRECDWSLTGRVMQDDPLLANGFTISSHPVFKNLFRTLRGRQSLSEQLSP